ncbi:DMT family transporter [Leeuwenhoekiella aequorea]|uniref:Threonine/homoserine efflux transporter RhtA n=2 Tax=Flavobacteriia TaxID=117743 RepID=A0A4Q0P669_9FLAO|nr:DMT family transporter [Leeuwenhoekiella aequorea]AOE06803.1 permease of the drug/metabolite transporter (DMT) superfamily [uncultured bacterium]RXG22147.1 threonine/homoserine efflux transporter RhtA [Leeuwenhoekiella aequorea]CCG00291.1 EamA-like transporter family protein [uncultured Flavobacteriia bacterium]
MDKRVLALLAATGASTIYGVNHTLAKGVMPQYIGAYGFILLRVVGAAALFWIASLFTKSEKVDPKDYSRLFGCAVFGMFINMLAFFKGLSLSTPINSSVIITLSPVILLVLSAIFLKEKISPIKIIGIAIGMLGALVLVLFGASTQANAPNIPLGNVLYFINGATYAIYLILVKPITNKYSTVTLMKWLFLTGVFLNLPFTISEFTNVNWLDLPTRVIWIMLFVVVGTTFSTYFLNLYALKTLKASTVGAFIYLQPLIAVIFAVLVGADRITPVRALAGLLIFAGVYLSTRTKKSKVT